MNDGKEGWGPACKPGVSNDGGGGRGPIGPKKKGTAQIKERKATPGESKQVVPSTCNEKNVVHKGDRLPEDTGTSRCRL